MNDSGSEVIDARREGLICELSWIVGSCTVDSDVVVLYGAEAIDRLLNKDMERVKPDEVIPD